MHELEKYKQKLTQQKHKLAMEEIRLDISARKLRTQYLIELGKLVASAKLDALPKNSFFGALLSLKELRANDQLLNEWSLKGEQALKLHAPTKSMVILKLDYNEYQSTSQLLKKYHLKWNKLRKEWYGYVDDANSLQQELQSINFDSDKITVQPL